MQTNEFDELLNHLNEKNLERYAKTHLSKEKQLKLKQILGDKNKLDKIMNSKEAGEILKKLKGRQHGQPR